MRCPFLREAQVKYCQASPFKKMIVRTPEHDTPERCSSSDYVQCPSAKQRNEEQPSQSHCPFLQESLVQYCSAASITKFIPYSESILSRCGNESHRFCDLYLALANPPGSAASATSSAPGGSESEDGKPSEEIMVDGIRVPTSLSYSANHMWLDINEDGCCHIGVDAFLTRILGSVEKLTFVAAKGVSRPAAVFSIKGADLQMVFPSPILVTRTNTYLRANPEKLLMDPYRRGWLFEGEPAQTGSEGPASASSGLIPGKSALSWMQEEFRRITGFIQDQIAKPGLQGETLMADGGCFAPGFVRYLSREEILNLFNEFFSPYASWRR